MNPIFIGEFLGTAILILLGGGVCAAVSLERTYARGAGWIVVTAGWACAVTCGIFVAAACGAPGSLNPVGPVLDILNGARSLVDGLGMIAAEVSGAFCGAVLVWLAWLPHWEVTADAAAKRGVFCTAPAIPSPFANLLCEAIGTFALVLITSCIGKFMPSPGNAPLVGLVVWAIGLSLGAATGYAINPARDFGPRLAHALLPIAGKGDSNWGYAWVPIAGPLLGAIAGSFVFRLAASIASPGV
ncbi:MAG: hypothetical protein RL215_1343 [Planctomycetota bacterium]|jgi:glycerol uptake facilitator protein